MNKKKFRTTDDTYRTAASNSFKYLFVDFGILNLHLYLLKYIRDTHTSIQFLGFKPFEIIPEYRTSYTTSNLVFFLCPVQE